MEAKKERKFFQYVYIPTDISVPIQQMEMELMPGQEVEGFLDRLKHHFRSTNPSKTAAQIQAQKAELVAKLPAGTPIDENLLSIATSLQMVENISLLSNAPDNGYVGVNMYVDDEGSVRGALQNLRATELAHCCGQPISVQGDAFLARVMDNGDDFERLDLKLDEISSSAGWVKAASVQAAQRRQRDSAETVMQRMQVHRQGTVGVGGVGTAAVQAGTPAEAAKEEGNAAFKRGEWEVAAEHYSRAIELDSSLVAALNNRAMAWLKLDHWTDALEDCEAVLALQPFNVKALLRAAVAERELGRIDSARYRLETALSVEPKNKEAQERLAELNE